MYQDVDICHYDGNEYNDIETTDYDYLTYPFYFYIEGLDDETLLEVRTPDSAETHTISIVLHYKDIHHIDPKYIKDMYNSNLTEVVSGSITNIVWDANPWEGAISAEYSDSIYEWLNNMTLKVSPDNDSYVEPYAAMSLTINGKTRWITDDYVYMLGAAEWNIKYGANAYFQMESFWGSAIRLFEGALSCQRVNPRCIELFGLTSADEVTDIEFTIYNGAFKRIDEKYIPNTIARVEDAPILTSPSGKKFKITVDDSGTVSAVEVTE